MKIIHFSDWHSKWERLPSADVYVCSGDMLNNAPLIDFWVSDKKSGRKLVTWDPEDQRSKKPKSWISVQRRIDPARELKFQERWMDAFGRPRGVFGNPDAPVVCVRGNHDFTDLGPWFGGDVFEITEDPTRTKKIKGLTFGGVRGVSRYLSEWSDELDPPQWADRAAKLPDDINILVTHCPPQGMMDEADELHIGSDALANYVNRQVMRGKLKLHCFGHVHEKHGLHIEDGVIFSNAATMFREIEI